MTTKTAQIDAAIAAQNAVQAQQNGRISTLESRMDTFASLPSGSTSGNAELLDIRTNFLGETYPTAGDAVRASDMIASGFQSIPATLISDWNGNDESSVYDTIQIDISAYKGGHIVVIGTFLYFQFDIQEIGKCSVYATNISGATEDTNAVNYAPGSAVFKSLTQITTAIQDEERLLLQFAIPEDYSYQYLKIGHVEHTPNPAYYTDPLYIVYGNSWSKTPVDDTLSVAGEAADAKATGDALEQLNERLQTYVSLTGENQVEPQNIAGVTFTKTEEETEGANIFTSDMLFEEGYYIYINTNVNPPVITHGVLSGFNAYCVPIEPGTTYHFTYARFACTSKGNTLGSEATSELKAYATSITATEDTHYLFLTYPNTTSISDISVKPVTVSDVYSDFVMPSWMNTERDKKTKYSKETGNFSASGDYILLENTRNDLRKGTRLVFEGTVTSGTDFEIGFSVNISGINSAHNIITINNTNISYSGSDYEHGLTITGRVQLIFEYMDNGTADITLICNGNLFKQSIAFANNNPAVAYVKSNGLVASDCIFTFTCVDLSANIWLFGDSYIQYDVKRWAYYLHQYGYDKHILLNGFAGEGSVNARVSMNSLLNFGMPKFAIWCMGMNDGSDPNDTTPSSNWVSGRDYFLGYCNANNIIPIFATIPNVPTINNKGKNSWIKSSEYRYIDFAHAVGSDTNVNWFTGMLANDGVHPTETGAKALFAQFLLDFPEVMLK